MSATDARLWLALAAAVALSGTAPCWLPARRAAHVEVMEVLRSDE